MLKLYNTMTRSLMEFKQRNKNEVKIFTCGPSIYRRPHIGNYRTFLYEDVLIRYLEYLGYKVNRIINFTDVEDKMIEEARGKEFKALRDKISEYFYKETELLNIKLPQKIPASSTTVDEAVRLIKVLLDKGYAYWHNGNIFFDPLKFKGFGKLFRLDMKKWPAQKKRFKRDTYTGRRWNLGDFILWHGVKNDDIFSWDTELGKGRPSWNIQDPAVVCKHLGYEIDINCGGIDNLYRHHDYNIAVIESVSGKEYANYYLHGEHLMVNGRKMSKSRGNILYPEDILKKGFKPYHLRFFLIYRHYRKRLNFRDDFFKKSSKYLDSFRVAVSNLLNKPPDEKSHDNKGIELIKKIQSNFETHMNNDLHLGDAFDEILKVINQIVKKQNTLSSSALTELKNMLKRINSVFQFMF
jgi:cysteinyl-tRNA synthetase